MGKAGLGSAGSTDRVSGAAVLAVSVTAVTVVLPTAQALAGWKWR